MDSTVVFPTIRHAIEVCVSDERAGEIDWPPSIGDLILLDIVQAILIAVAVSISRVGRVEESVVAIFESVGHSVAIGIPVSWAIEATVAIHVLIEPS